MRQWSELQEPLRDIGPLD